VHARRTSKEAQFRHQLNYWWRIRRRWILGKCTSKPNCYKLARNRWRRRRERNRSRRFSRVRDNATCSFQVPCPLCIHSGIATLGMKCWNSAFNAQGSRVITVIVQVSTVKIYVTAPKALEKKKKRRQNIMKLSSLPKMVLFWVSPPLMLMYFFGKFFLNLTRFWPNSGFWCCVFLILQKTLFYE
jgi:hypothetical protein